MAVTNALIIDHQIASFASAQRDDTIALHPNYFNIFRLRHAQNFEDEVRQVFRALDLENFILLAVDINLIRVLGFAELAGADLVDRGEAIVLIVVKATTTEPFPEARKMDVAAGACTVAWCNEGIVNTARVSLLRRTITLSII